MPFCHHDIFGQLIFWKIIRTVAIRGHILRLKCTKFFFSLGSAPDPTGGAYSAPPDPELDLRGLLLRGRRRGKGNEGRKGNGRKNTKGEGEGGVDGKGKEEM